MPPIIRDLISQLERAGFKDRGGKGSLRNFVHPNVHRPITISGQLGEDARLYLIRAVAKAREFPRFSGHPELTIQEVQNAKTRAKNSVQVQR